LEESRVDFSAGFGDGLHAPFVGHYRESFGADVGGLGGPEDGDREAGVVGEEVFAGVEAEEI
jgi:hypothetical protein